MRDKLSEIRCRSLHPKYRGVVIATIDEIESRLPENVAVRLVQTKRSKEDQDAIYAQGRTTPGNIVTRAQFYQTTHFYGTAFDFCFIVDKDGNGSYETISWDRIVDSDKDKVADWMEVINAFKAKGFLSGADWKSFPDYPHIEAPYSWRTLYKKYLNKEFFIDPETKIQYVIL